MRSISWKAGLLLIAALLISSVRADSKHVVSKPNVLLLICDDLYPTLAEMCGLAAPSHLAGVSLAPLQKDINVMPRSTALTQLQNYKPRHERTYFGYTIRTMDRRYTEWGTAGRKRIELYDHASDPEEMINLAEDPAYAKTVSTLSQLLRRRIDEAQKTPQGLEQIVNPSAQ